MHRRKTSWGEEKENKVTNEQICWTNSRNHPQSRSILRDCATSPRDDYLIERSRRRLVLLNLGDLKTDYDVNKKDFTLLKYTICQAFSRAIFSNIET